MRMRASVSACSVAPVSKAEGILVRLLCLLMVETSHVQVLDVALSLEETSVAEILASDSVF